MGRAFKNKMKQEQKKAQEYLNYAYLLLGNVIFIALNWLSFAIIFDLLFILCFCMIALFFNIKWLSYINKNFKIVRKKK
jgi:hypothetical protein